MRRIQWKWSDSWTEVLLIGILEKVLRDRMLLSSFILGAQGLAYPKKNFYPSTLTIRHATCC